MATITVTNVSSDPVYISDFYASLDPNESLTVTRPMSLLGTLTSLLSLSQAGTITYTITPSDDETAEGVGSSTTQLVVFRPGGDDNGNTFTSFASAAAAAAAQDGVLYLNDDLTGVTIPDGTYAGIRRLIADNRYTTQLDVTVGDSKFPDLRYIEGLNFSSTAETAIIDTFGNNNEDVLELVDVTLEWSPAIEIPALVGISATLICDGEVSGTLLSSDAISAANGLAGTINVEVRGKSQIKSGSFRDGGLGFATLVFRSYSSLARYSVSHANWSGSISTSLSRKPTEFLTIVPSADGAPHSSGAIFADYGNLIRVDPSAGGVSVTLPSSFGDNFGDFTGNDAEGSKVVVKNVTVDTTLITVNAGGGDLVEGGASVNVGGTGWDSATFIANGYDGWYLVD